MTTIYTKPQIDAMAVKIGGEIKAAKTTVTQSQGQSTTEAVSQKMITDSLSAFGTAATKNVGTAAGNVMEVGAFGLGSTCVELPVGTDIKTHPFVTGFYMGVGLLNSPAYSDTGNYWFYYEVMIHNDSYMVIIAHGLFDTNRGSYKLRKEGGIWGEWEGIANSPVHYNQTTSKLPNLVVSETGEIKRSSAVDPNGSLAVSSIQAGIGAPKIAYKKLTGTLASAAGDTSVAHGLDVNKILSVDVWVVATSGDRYSGDAPTVQHRFTKRITSTSIIINTLTTASYVMSQPFTAIITYEV